MVEDRNLYRLLPTSTTSTNLYRLLERIPRPQLEDPPGRDAIKRNRVLHRKGKRIDPATVRDIVPGLLDEVLLLEAGSGLPNQAPTRIDEVQHVEHVSCDLECVARQRRDRPTEPRIQEVLPGIATGVPRRQPAAVILQTRLVDDVLIEQVVN